MPEFLRIATAVFALALAAWGLYSVFRNRPPDRSHLVGVIILEAMAVVLVGAAVAGIADGHKVTNPSVFFGYLAAFLIIPPAGLAMARMEPTKWGSMIIAVLGIVEAILVVRLQQVWTGF